MDRKDNLQDSLKTAIIRACDSNDIALLDADDIEITQMGSKDAYEAKITVVGRVLYDELTESQGTLLYMKDDIEVSLKGMASNRLLLEVTLRD